MEPRLCRRDDFTVVGMGAHFTPETRPGIGDLWQEFHVRLGEIPCRRGALSFGICLDADPACGDAPGFTYVAAVEVDRIERIPPGMEALSIPANAYAVFTWNGHISAFADFITAVWAHHLPAAHLDPIRAPDFELYDERFDPATNQGTVEVWIPVRQRAAPAGAGASGAR